MLKRLVEQSEINFVLLKELNELKVNIERVIFRNCQSPDYPHAPSPPPKDLQNLQ